MILSVKKIKEDAKETKNEELIKNIFELEYLFDMCFYVDANLIHEDMGAADAIVLSKLPNFQRYRQKVFSDFMDNMKKQ